jgi:O-antigen/teichoic acid export membrane protein
MNSENYGNHEILGTSLSEADHIKRQAASGAVWVSLVSAAAMLVAYYCNWVLGSIGPKVIGSYALILIFTQSISTFIMFGGVNVFTHFLPKITCYSKKSAFLATYTSILLGIALIFMAIVALWPSSLELLIRSQIDFSTLLIFDFLVPVFVVSQIVVFSLAGLMQFRLYSVISRFQVFLVCILGTFAYLLFPGLLAQYPFPILTATVCIAGLLILLCGGYAIIKRLGRLVFRFYLPPRFWKYTSYIHVNTITPFLFQTIDQIFVFARLGTRELGAYFIMLQCAQLIRFIPKQTSQVMLASFSHSAISEQHTILKGIYAKLCRLNLIISTFLVLMLILFSRNIAAIFGEYYKTRYLYLMLLSLGVNIGNLGNINSMLIISRDRARDFFVNNLILVILQFGVTIFLIERLGIYAAILGRIVGIISGQVGLFLIIRWRLGQIHLALPREFWFSQAAAVGAALAARYIPYQHPFFSFIVMTCLFALFLLSIRFRLYEIAHVYRGLKRNSVNLSNEMLETG